MSAPEYATATGLKGFCDTTLRVRVMRREGDTVWVRTADIRDAGTPLVLDALQLGPAPEDLSIETMSHKDGLISFEG